MTEDIPKKLIRKGMYKKLRIVSSRIWSWVSEIWGISKSAQTLIIKPEGNSDPWAKSDPDED